MNQSTIINKILEREYIAEDIKKILQNFDENNADLTYKKGIYIYGAPGCGKTEFVIQLLKEMNYDIIKYDAGDVRNKSLIDTITSDNIANCNVLNSMQGNKKKIAIIMDEIDGMNNGDKGGISSLIKLIRQKKTKKQKMENKTMNPIICIGNYYIDKKIRELMKVCNAFELKPPTTVQMTKMIDLFIPNLKTKKKQIMLKFLQGDIRKLSYMKKLYEKKPELLDDDIIENIFHNKSYNEDAKKTTQLLINKPVSLKEHVSLINETDRTIIALLWHENIVDILNKTEKRVSIPFYQTILKNICYADYIDRITFQNQIWLFNEMSSLMKTFYNNKLYHDNFPENQNKFKPTEVRFTKVLTKYSTEYNNMLFIFNLCQELDMEKKDLISFFQELRFLYGKEFYNNNEVLGNVEKMFENYDINKLDIKRMYRYLDKNVKKDTILGDELDIDIEVEDE
jgi:DNA polymerase III delta prime subunit